MEGGLRSVRQAVVLRCRHIGGRVFRASDETDGFTIVEVMIVLAVTGLLFLSAATAISGKQSQTAFDQAVQQVQGQIQQTMNDVSIGYYPNAGNFQCTASGTGPTFSGVSNGQGTNSGCIFVGKVMQFKIAGSAPEQFETYSVAGLQQNATGQDVQSLAEAKPAVIPSSSVPGTLQSGLTTYKMTYNNGGIDQVIGAVAFTNSFASYSNGSIVSGSQQISVVPIVPKSGHPGLGESTANTADDINTNLASGVVNPSNGVSICFVSGGTNQSAKIVIGGNNHPLAVTLTIKAGTVC